MVLQLKDWYLGEERKYFFNMKILNFSLRVYDECCIKIEIFSHCFQCPVLFCKIIPPQHLFFLFLLIFSNIRITYFWKVSLSKQNPLYFSIKKNFDIYKIWKSILINYHCSTLILKKKTCKFLVILKNKIMKPQENTFLCLKISFIKIPVYF